MTLTIGSLFSGIGGLELGLERAGLGPVLWQCEIDPFARRVLAKHWPTVTRFEDVTQPRDYPHVDVVCGGFPCQDVSSLGRRRGLAGARSGLWYHFASVVSQVRPRLVVVENVASGVRAWLPTVRRQLCELGYRTRAYALSASEVGASQRRKRVFVVADAAPLAAAGAASRVHGEGARGDDLAGRHCFPPGPRDAEGWRAYAGRGGAEPSVRRGAHGIPGQLDRLRALGNAVVPQCAEAIGRVIMSTHTKGVGHGR